jgi:hypothetical protein
MAATTPVLSTRALNRALLARQHLLRRSTLPPQAMVDHLVGLQAQNPLDPYIALWSRLEGFDPASVAQLIEERAAVRMGLLRTTLHLVTADDALTMWPVFADVLRRSWRSSPFRKALDGVDVDAVVAAARDSLAQQPQTTAELGRRLAGRWPAADAKSMSYAARFLLPIVQVPPRGLWGRATQPQAAWTTLEAWLGRPLPTERSLDALILRYLGAFGPASTADMRTWSWLTGLREVVERLRPQLVTFSDEQGRELFDLPDAPRPDPETPAPPRYLPEYDNVALSHDDRTRIIATSAFGRLTGWVGTFTVDGFIRGQWRTARSKESATLILEAFEPLAEADSELLAAEGERLLALQVPDLADRRLEFGIARAAAPDGSPGIGGTRGRQVSATSTGSDARRAARTPR